jgi:hypothetical protein
MRTFLYLIVNIAGIVVSGALGGFAGVAVREAAGLGGIGGALLALVVAMPVATLAWVLSTLVLRALHLVR